MSLQANCTRNTSCGGCWIFSLARIWYLNVNESHWSFCHESSLGKPLRSIGSLCRRNANKGTEELLMVSKASLAMPLLALADDRLDLVHDVVAPHPTIESCASRPSNIICRAGRRLPRWKPANTAVPSSEEMLVAAWRGRRLSGLALPPPVATPWLGAASPIGEPLGGIGGSDAEWRVGGTLGAEWRRYRGWGR